MTITMVREAVVQLPDPAGILGIEQQRTTPSSPASHQ
jgi:hypothetical protein